MSSNIRNFAIISHIDHGKSTLADRLMELTGLIPPSPPGQKTPRIDRMELEVERGVTIKLKAVRMSLEAQYMVNGAWKIVKNNKPLTVNHTPVQRFVLNMIDTPGHVDFSYEVSRSLAACEGALLLVDATQGPQAQTVAHLEKAKTLGLAVIGVINKIDSRSARVEETEEDMRRLGIEGEIIEISALKGQGIEAIPKAIVERVPPPKGDEEAPFRALVFDSTYDEHLGVIAYVRVVDGELEAGSRKQEAGVKFLGTGREARVKEMGHFVPDRKLASRLSSGEVGYIATGLKDPRAVRAGDTVVRSSGGSVAQLPGYEEPRSFVFASFFTQKEEFSDLKEALEKLRLEEPAVSIEETSSPALGRGFKLGFLGTFHLEIVKERLEREFDLKLVVTKPSVSFRGVGGHQPEEPWIRVTAITPPKYLSGVSKLIIDRRGELGEVAKFGSRMRLNAELPLMEFVVDFYDRLKSLSSGYASLDWEFIGYRPADLVKLDIAVHGEVAEGLSEVVVRDRAQKIGRDKVEKLKEVMPRKQFAYAIQAKVAPSTSLSATLSRAERVGGKVLARADVPAMRKDVTGHLYGGDVTRKRKLLKKQKKGKKALAAKGRVEVPPEAFLV